MAQMSFFQTVTGDYFCFLSNISPELFSGIGDECPIVYFQLFALREVRMPGYKLDHPVIPPQNEDCVLLTGGWYPCENFANLNT